MFLVYTQAFRINAAHDGDIGYTMAFLYSDWLYFLWYGIKETNACLRSRKTASGHTSGMRVRSAAFLDL